jgi:hypothetical protein
MVGALVQEAPPRITLHWLPDSPEYGYSLARRLPSDTGWGPITSLASNATEFADETAVAGVGYEYSIFKDFTKFTGEGYILAGLRCPLTESRGKIVLVVESNQAVGLALELARLEQDLAGDGWTVLRRDVPRAAVDPADISPGVGVARSNEVASVKALIKAAYNSDPANVKAVFLLGHIPVPYSGNLYPDGHTDHRGAWPADVYYGDLTGAWTDTSVNTTSAGNRRNWNVPGDGKFDQTELTAVVRLEVGRADFANLPAFSQGEQELLRQYLNKNHHFRHGRLVVQRRGLIDDHFGILGQEAFAANGWRNFAPFFGPSNIVAGDWLSVPAGATYLWAYGCGGGTYTSASGVANTWNLVTNDTPFVFTMLFGSYFGDWDSQNNLLRAQLATATHTLSCAWAGRPYWYFHHMALGETLGFGARLSQNGTYGNSLGLGMVHVALMGDPTLRLHPVLPPAGLKVTTNASGGVDLSWAPSPEPVLGYHVYRGSNVAGPFTRLTSSLVTGTTYSDPVRSTNVYLVRAVKLEETPSGSYYNASQGIFQNLEGSAGSPRIEIVQPTNNSVFGPDAVIRIAASLFDPANAVTNVVFLANGLKLGDASGPSHTLIWSNAPVGIHTITAWACSLDGAQTLSPPLTVRVDHAGSPRLAIVRLAGGSNLISGQDVLGRTYRVLASDNPAAGLWQTLGTATGTPSGHFEFLDSAAVPQRFYRTVFP